MTRTNSEFDYAITYIDGRSLASAEALHAELAFKLGLPQWYGRNWDALLDCLSSIDDPSSNLCEHWEFRTGKRMFLQVKAFSTDHTDTAVLGLLMQTIADANNRLNKSAQGVSIWLQFAG